MTIMTNARFDPASVTADEGGICLMVGPEGKEPAELRAELMLVATGRAANIEDIGLETTKVETDRGVIKVNGRMRTKEPHVYAIGDAIGGLWLAHTAAHEGLIAAHTIAGDADVHDMDYTTQPRATYCRPEIASIGLTEAQATAAGHKLKIGKVPFQAIAKALIGGEYEGFAKVIADAETNDTLGVHIVGPHATDLIAEASLGFELEATPWEIGGATHAHPDPVGGHRRGGDGRRRAVAQLLGEGGPGRTRRAVEAGPAAMAVTKGSDSHLGAALGLTDADLVEMYRYVALARAVDERMWILNRAGRIPFVISGQGHEGAQVGIAWAFQRGHDWIAPFYRSIATCLTFGMSARDIMTAQYATASDPSSGGRQMPGHYGSHEHNLVSVSSPVATQLLHAVGIALAAKIRKTGQVAMASMGEGSSQPGRRPRGPQLRGDPQAAVRVRGREQRLRDQRAGGDGGLGRRRRRPGVGLRDPGRRGRRRGRARLLRGGARRGRAGPRGRGPDADRGQGDPADRALLGRPADQVPDRGGARRREGPRRAARVPRRSSATPAS